MLGRNHRWLLGVVLVDAVATGGCGSPDICARRPWECETGGTGGTDRGESTGSCENHQPPPVSSLTENAKLPDPFSLANGSRISRKAQWACRRAEISAQAQAYELGAKPEHTGSVVGASAGDAIEVTVSEGERTISFTAAIEYPTTGEPPYPAMIGVGGISIGASELHDLGVATIVFPNDSIAEQISGSSRGNWDGLWITT